MQTAQVGADGSYLSQHTTDLHFGLGSAATADEVRIVWPDGHEELHTDVAVDRLVTYTHRPDYRSAVRAALAQR